MIIFCFVFFFRKLQEGTYAELMESGGDFSDFVNIYTATQLQGEQGLNQIFFFVVVSFVKDSCVYLTSAEFNLNVTAYLADLIESRFVNDKTMLFLEERRARGYTYLEEIHELDSERSEDMGKASFSSNILAKINICFNHLTNLFYTVTYNASHSLR